MRLLRTVVIAGGVIFGSCFCGLSYNIAIWPGDDASIWAPSLNLTNVVQISGGNGHAMALRADGTVVRWSGPYSSDMGVTNGVQIASGWCHDLGVLADGTVMEWGLNPPNCGSTAPGATSMPAGLTGIIGAAGGEEHSIVLKSDGTCVSWGWMTVGAAYVPAGLTNVTAVAAGFDISAALKSDGSVANWGYANYGGTGGDGLTGISAIALGHSDGLALRSNGTVVVWGGTLSQPPVTLTNVVKIGAKQTWACALQADGTLISWGDNLGGQLTSPDQPLTNVIQLAPMNYAGMLLVGDGPPQPLWKLPATVAIAESTVIFKGEAVGTEPLAYQWFFNGTNLPGATTPTLTLSNVQPSQVGSYYVVVGNGYGVRTNSGAQLDLIPAVITAQPTNQTVFGGDTVTFNVGVQGPGLTYQWQFFGTNLDGTTNAPLILTNVTTSQAGDYSVLITNSYGSLASSNATLTVVPIAITTQPAGLSRYVGDSASFSVAATKNGPFAYQWRFNGSDLPGQITSTLTLVGLNTTNGGNYTVLVSNPYGALESSAAHLSVVNTKPIISAQPVNQGAYPNGGVSFGVTADGSKPLSYQWRVNGTNILNANNPTLTLTNLAFSDAGNYSVLVSNPAGSTLSSNATLTFLAVVTWGGTNGNGLGNVPLELTNVLAIAAGSAHSVALKSTGKVVAWGYNGNGQTNVPANLSNVVAIAAGGNHSLAVKQDGTVVSWGDLTTVPAFVTNVVAAAAGDSHSLALRADGTVVAWGTGTATNTPAGLTNVMAITAGGFFSVALKADKTVVVWGASISTTGMTNVVAISASEFPIIALRANGTVAAAGTPAPPASLTNAVAVAAGRYGAIALKANSAVTNWGSGFPVTPSGLTNVAAIASGQNHCLAILGNGPQPAIVPFTNPNAGSNSFSVSVPSQRGHVYWLEGKTSLTDPNWTPLPLAAGNGGMLTLTDSTATNALRFYRVRQW
ncbi:MAG: hypothetical protein JWR19_2654 [Pedosphaera sp.]|nr:hypothetical protein [Pedosphaera sp.]